MEFVGEDIVIKVEDAYKDFVLPHDKKSTLKSAFTHLLNPKNKKDNVQHALKNINFEVKNGEFFGIVGRNGSGKSTLLKMLAGIYRPNKGSVGVRGKIVPFIELGVGFNPELSGRDNVYLNGALLGFSKKEIDGLYDEIVSFAELEKFMDQKLKNYSSGMQVRLAFSLAIKAKADVLLIDEVLAVGDANFQRKCYRYFKKLKKDKKSVIFVTHDMDSVREYCDRAMLIDNSEIKFIGHPDEVAREYLKLLSPKTENIEVSSQKDRWGDQTCVMSNLKVSSVTEEEVVFEFTATAKRDCDDPVFGFRIRSSEGTAITGTNSLILGHKVKALKKGESRRISWRIENIFAEGEYLIDPSIVYDSTVSAADWWDAALVFNVRRDRHIPYLVQPGMRVDIK